MLGLFTTLDCSTPDQELYCIEDKVASTALPATLCILLLASTWHLSRLHSQPLRTRMIKSIRLILIKSILLGWSCLCMIANSAVTIARTRSPHIFLEILEPVALFALLLLTLNNHQRSRRASTISLLFWPAYVLESLVWIHINIFPDLSRLRLNLYLRCTSLLLGVLAWALECQGPEQPEKGENPILTANIYSRWFYMYLTPLMKKGSQEYITEEDLSPLTPDDSSGKLGDDFKRAHSKHKSLWIALGAAYGGPYFIALCLKIVQDSLAFLQPQLLRLLLVYISTYQDARHLLGESPGPLWGFVIAATMFIAAVMQSIILNQYFQLCFETGMRIRAGLITAIYDKALRLSNDERDKRQTGDIVNLMSIDATRMQDLCAYGLISISGPFQIILALVSLYELLGPATFAGVAVMVFSIPLNTMVASKLKKVNEVQLKYRDQRTRLINELLANIKSIKLYAWEFAFMRRILAVRNDLELKNLKTLSLLSSLVWVLWGSIPLLVAFSSFVTAALISSRPLTSDVIFPAVSLFILLQFPLAMIGQVTSSIIQAVVSIRRLSEFLQAGEVQTSARKIVQKTDLNIGDEVLKIQRGEFWWSNKSTEPALRDINLSVKEGELIGVLGRVGAGKTSILEAIVGDMTRTDGEVLLCSSVAYAPQDPWILSASVRDNILFHHEYDELFYSLVLEACALKPDLEILPQGDLTEVGEKGITLSGGQRARVALARAVYARADLTLLDDVLAAVDAHVARHLFNHVIGPNGLLSTKARIVCTNSVTFLNQFTRLVYLRRGVIEECGTYQSLSSNPESEIYKLAHNHHHASGTSTPFAKTGTSTPQSDSATVVVTSQQIMDAASIVPEKDNGRPIYSKAVRVADTATSERRNGSSKEHVERGQVKGDVYIQYIKSASTRGFVFAILAMVGREAMILMANYSLREWGESNRGSERNMYRPVLFYGLFSLLSTLLTATSSILMLLYLTLRSAKYLHDSVLHAVMRAPLSFFDLTPTGRIMNIFSRDTYVVDQLLGSYISSALRTAAMCLAVLAVISWSFPPFLLVIPPLAWFYLRVLKYYLLSSRELKRLDAVTKSPIFAWFSESLAGVSTIRAFAQQSIFISENHRCIDNNQMAYLPSITMNRWLSLRLDVVGATITLSASLLALISLLTRGVDAGLVGLVLSYALNTTSTLNWVVRSASEVEQNIVSVERMMHYISLPSEAPYEIEGVVDEEWPTHGEIEFRNYSTKYRPELDLVLKDVSMVIKPKEKIGVCGRTGAGKSSLLLAILRIIEPVSGSIFIDGIDIATVGLHDLRSRITIVPQSAELYSGSLRELIDPLGVHQDADIWAALGQSHLRDYVESLPERLDANVSEGGSSLSSGQRQLLCFARALLRKSKIIVLDEATSAVDLDTDKAIQEIIRGPQFYDVTMITIAHRLNTIMDSHRVLVLHNGRVAELDTPANLLANPQSMFYSLAAEAGLADSSVSNRDANAEVTSALGS